MAGSAVPHVVNAGKYLAGLLFTATLLVDSAVRRMCPYQYRKPSPFPGLSGQSMANRKLIRWAGS